MKNILLKIYLVWVCLVTALLVLVFTPLIVLPFIAGSKGGTVAYTFIRLWVWCFSALTQIRYKVEGEENLQQGEAYIYTFNHRSHLDGPAMPVFVQGQFRPLAKKSLAKIPVFGWITQAAAVVVDRSSPENRKKSTEKLKRVLSEGISIAIAPEGTRNDSNKTLLPFYDGAFKIAIATQTSVVPVTIQNADSLMPKNRFFVQPGIIKIRIGKPISTVGMTDDDLAKLKTSTSEKIKEMYLNIGSA